MQNRIYTCKNPHQGAFKRVLCVCSAGLLRSPTTAAVLSAEPFNLNTRSAGIEESYALVYADEVLVKHWADLIVCMTEEHYMMLKMKYDADYLPEVIVLNIPDNYAYRDPELVRLITERFSAYLKEVKGV